MQRPDFERLTNLLDSQSLSAKETVEAKRLLAGLGTLSTVITRTRKVEVDADKSIREELRHEVEWTPEEAKFYDEYLTWCVARAQEKGTPLYFAMQMPLRLASACLPMAKQAVLNPQAFGKIQDEDEPDLSGDIAPHHDLVMAAKRLPDGTDSKYDELLSALKELHRQGKRAILFTFSRPTISYLRDRLAEHFRVAVMHGGVSRDERRTIMADFRAGALDFLLANRVASEGLDFEFCSAVINYDLPWNPMEIEQRIGRIDRIGQPEDKILILNFVSPETIDERIVTRLLDRIRIFESSIGALEPIIAEEAPKAIQAGLDFSLSDTEREQRIESSLLAIEEKSAGLRDISDASTSLLVTDDVDVDGLEEDLVRTGKYIGQMELVHLVSDWAAIEGAPAPTLGKVRPVVEIRGNGAMAARVVELARTARRTAAETHTLADQLRHELSFPLALEQEYSRTSGVPILSANHPLILAALSVPDYEQVRFASVRIEPDKQTPPGVYLVVLTKAVASSSGGDEIWGEAVSLDGAAAPRSVADALLAGLARGQLENSSCSYDPGQLPRLASRCMDQLAMRQEEEQIRRMEEFYALRETRKAVLQDQCARRIAAIEQRVHTAKLNRRSPGILRAFEGQRQRAISQRSSLLEDLERRGAPAISLESIAACLVEITHA
jgi:hypothetical protein